MKNREDIHDYIVHLTKDTNLSAVDNLVNILHGGIIEARRSHSLFSHHIRNFRGECKNLAKFRYICNKKFRVVCFTETPISSIKHLTTRRPKEAKIKLTNYGIVFCRNFIIKKGGNPAIYCNGYNKDSLSDTLKKRIIDELGNIAKKNPGQWDDELSEFSCFWGLFNTMKRSYDYSWEREWRHLDDFTFNINDVSGILVKNKQSFKIACDKKNKTLYQDIINLRIPIINPSRSSDIEEWVVRC